VRLEGLGQSKNSMTNQEQSPQAKHGLIHETDGDYDTDDDLP
jgi:hypothetical protein